MKKKNIFFVVLLLLLILVISLSIYFISNSANDNEDSGGHHNVDEKLLSYVMVIFNYDICPSDLYNIGAIPQLTSIDNKYITDDNVDNKNQVLILLVDNKNQNEINELNNYKKLVKPVKMKNKVFIKLYKYPKYEFINIYNTHGVYKISNLKINNKDVYIIIKYLNDYVKNIKIENYSNDNNYIINSYTILTTPCIYEPKSPDLYKSGKNLRENEIIHFNKYKIYFTTSKNSKQLQRVKVKNPMFIGLVKYYEDGYSVINKIRVEYYNEYYTYYDKYTKRTIYLYVIKS